VTSRRRHVPREAHPGDVDEAPASGAVVDHHDLQVGAIEGRKSQPTATSIALSSWVLAGSSHPPHVVSLRAESAGRRGSDRPTRLVAPPIFSRG
jgi:hypothetical protein